MAKSTIRFSAPPKTRFVSQQSFEQLNTQIPGTGLTVAQTLGFTPVVRTEQNLGAPLAGFKTPRDLTVEERIIGGSDFGKLPPGKPLPPLFGGTFQLPTPPEISPTGSGAFTPDAFELGDQTPFRPGTPQAELARVLSANANTAAGAAGIAGTAGIVSPGGAAGGAGIAAGGAGIAGAAGFVPSAFPGSLTFAGRQGGTTTSDASLAFGTLSSADRLTAPGLPVPLAVPAIPAARGLLAGGVDRPGAGVGRRRLAGQLVRRVRDPEPQGAVLRTRPLSSLQPRRRASVDPVKKRLLNTLVR